MNLPPFQILLDTHGRDVHRFLIATVGVTDADDCYQETWLSALRAYPTLRSASNLRGWLLTIAHHKAMDNFRAGVRRPVPVESLPEPPRVGAASVVGGMSAVGDPAAALSDGDLWGAVADLPPKQRAAIALRFIADSDYGEIGQVMQTSEEAARRSVHEGLKRLRKEQLR